MGGNQRNTYKNLISTSSLRASRVSLIIESKTSETIKVLLQNSQRHVARVHRNSQMVAPNDSCSELAAEVQE